MKEVCKHCEETKYYCGCKEYDPKIVERCLACFFFDCRCQEGLANKTKTHDYLENR